MVHVLKQFFVKFCSEIMVDRSVDSDGIQIMFVRKLLKKLNASEKYVLFCVFCCYHMP